MTNGRSLEVGGFRIDAVPFLLEDPQLRNEATGTFCTGRERGKKNPIFKKCDKIDEDEEDMKKRK